MATVTESTTIVGVHHVGLTVHRDERGSFVETYRRAWIPGSREMIQANRGDRSAGSLVGLHYHLHQADYWYVVGGHARVVLHDLREGMDMVEEKARFELGMVRPNEILVQITK